MVWTTSRGGPSDKSVRVGSDPACVMGRAVWDDIMLKAMAIVFGLLIAGDALAGATAAPVPGPALGLAALTACFAARRGADADLAALFDAVAPHAPLLFIPAAAGIVAHLDLLAAQAAAIAAAVLLGTAAALVAAGLAAQALLAAETRREREA